ncbi:MAG TPA: tetratricopeptide repeat protein [Xanthobacteraceae bacterium]|nr:tetratricopeptide repeat protein [Xanthobacteraceae bacterium]
MLRIGALLIALVAAAPPALAEASRDCQSNNHEAAIRGCTRLIQQNPRNAVNYFNRAISYRELGKVDLALADYDRAIELNPRYYEALNNRGTIYISRGDNERALEDFTRSTEVNPRYAIAHNNRGEALENLERLEEALAAYGRAIEFNPKYARAYANRGDIWRKLGKRDDAIADYRHALRLDPQQSIALAGLKILGNTSASTGPVDPPPQRDPFARPEQVARPAPTQPPPREKGGSTGTGFFVSPQGHILTNHHVVENCNSISVALNGEVSQSARLVTSDSKNDLALLTTTGFKPGSVATMRLGVRLGENVFVYGFPLSGLLASSGNFTTGSVTAVAGLGDDTTMLQLSAPVQPGNSGGPVLDQHGNVVGVIVSKLNALRIAKVTSGDIPQNVNFAIKSLIAMSFLESGNVSASATARTAKLDAPEIAEQARAFTAQVRCN